MKEKLGEKELKASAQPNSSSKSDSISESEKSPFAKKQKHCQDVDYPFDMSHVGGKYGLAATLTCKYCGKAPCVMDTEHYDDIMEKGEALQYEGMANKAIRYELNRHIAYILFGKLGSSNRNKLPACVTGEILDSFPEVDRNDFTGFKDEDANAEE